MPPELLPASQGSDADGDSREEDGGDAGAPAVPGREPAPNELASRPCPTTHRASGAPTRPWEGGAARSSESPARSQGMRRGGARASVRQLVDAVHFAEFPASSHSAGRQGRGREYGRRDPVY